MSMVLINYLILFVVGMLPISEVRGAIPLAFVFFSGTELYLGILLSVIGNLLVCPPLLHFLRYLENTLLNTKKEDRITRTIKSLYLRAIKLARKKSESVTKYGLIGLTIFVAIPLPVTGAWTGTLMAHFLGFNRAKSILAIELGVIIASILVFIVVYTGVEILKRLFFF